MWIWILQDPRLIVLDPVQEYLFYELFTVDS
jgi:hypothetical protein